MKKKTYIERAEALLLETKRPVTTPELQALLKIPRDIAKNVMYGLRHKHGARLVRTNVGRYAAYQLLETVPRKKAVKVSAFLLPAKLWRGWCNPVTRYKPAMLGVRLLNLEM